MDRPRLIKELSEGPGSGILHALGTFLLLIVTVVLFSVRWTLSYDPVVGAESLMLRAPEPVRIALPGVASPAAHRYSRWQCVGGLEDVDSFEHRACVFSDVCYDTAAADFVFYAPPRNASVPIVYDHRRGAQRRFRHRRRDGDAVDADFVALSKWTPYRQHLSWSPSVHVGTVPSSGVQLRGLHALSAPFVPTNLGHVAWDEAFPLLVAMAQLGVYSTTLQIVRTAGCDVLPAASRHVCAKFAAAFLEPLLGVRGATLLTLQELVASHSPSRHLCFEQIVVGGSYDAFNSEALNEGKEPLLALYRARVLAWHAVPIHPPTRKHTILIVNKEGRRGIHNIRAVKRHVIAKYGDIADVVVTGFADSTMQQQLRLVARTTLAISPCGGISMILPFLPDGAHAILMNYMVNRRDARRHGECDGCSWSMEAELWRHVRHVHKQYYQVWGPDDFAHGEPGRDSAVKVNLPRLETLIGQALHDMQPW